ncbi:MAG: hypothetical protein Q8O46_04130 [bacterium]|nr:hypothetical protein [bacterium]
MLIGSSAITPTVGKGLTIAPAVRTSGSPSILTITAPADTTLTASTESISMNVNTSATRQFDTGALTTQRESVFQAPTYGFVGASTLTNAATLAISGAPVAGTNATLTNSYALWVQGGITKLAGTIIAGSGSEVITLATGKIDADALTLTTAADGGTGTSSGSGFVARSDGIGLLQGCSDTQVLAWVESTDTWDCTTSSSGGMSIGGSITSATQGSVLFAGAAGVLAQDNTNFFFNDTTNNFGIGTATPLTRLDVAGNVRTTGKATAVLTGSIDAIASTTVTGVSTLFTTELVVGDRITVTAETRTVTAIATNTSLTVDTAFTDTLNDTTPDVLYALHTARLSSNATGLVLNDLGNLGIGIAAPNKKLDVLDAAAAQLRLTSTAGSVYGELYADSAGDVGISSTGTNIRLINEDLFICSGGGCASSAPAGQGNLIIETGIKLDSGATLKFADTDVVLTHSTGILTMGTGDLRVTTAGTNTASVVTVGGTQTLTAKTLTTPVIGGTAAAAGQLGRDTTQQMLSYYDNGQLGNIPKILKVGQPTQSLTNSVTTDQDYTSIFTIPASYLIANKVLRVTLSFQSTTGVSSATSIHYVKLGTTKVMTSTAANNGDSTTRSGSISFLIYGTAAAGASVNVETMSVGSTAVVSSSTNTTTQPLALATNGTLAITPGVTFSATGSTETMVLRTYLIEELN